MNLNELTYNKFNINDYEHFLIEVFNINLAMSQDVSYMDNQHDNVTCINYYGSYLDDNFNDIELYVIKLGNIEDYKSIEDSVFNLLSLNQTNHAFIAVYSDYDDKWFYSYLFEEYRVEDNKLLTYTSKIDDYMHWCGYAYCEDKITDILNKRISCANLQSMLKNNYESPLILSLSDVIDKLDKYKDNTTQDFDSYELLLKSILHIINNKKPKDSLIKEVYKKVLQIQKSSDEELTIDTVYQLHAYLNNQKSISKTHIKSVCEDTLIEYLSYNTIISREDIVSYVKYAYTNRNLIKRHIDEAIKNGGKTFTNTKIPLSVIYNIDEIDRLLNDMKVLDFSINSTAVITTLSYHLAKLKYVNKLIQGYTQIDIDNLFNLTLKENIYMITLNTQSLITAKILLGDNLNLLYTDALNLYDEYEYIISQLDEYELDQSKSQIISMIIDAYNKTHFHTKMNINFEKTFRQKHGYDPLIYQLDFNEVFGNHNKFDIIISNIEHVNLTGKKDTKKHLKRYKVYDNNQRYEYYFIEKAVELISDNAIVSLIISDEYKSHEDKKVCSLLKTLQILRIDNNELIYAKQK